MFYVSDILGAQKPYEYRITPISRRQSSTSEVAAIDSLSPVESHIDPRHVTSKPVESAGHEAYQSQLSNRQRRSVVYADEIMSSPVFTLKSADTLREAAEAFKKHKFRHIPIVGVDRKLVGILSDRDFFGIALNDQNRQIQIKEAMTTEILTARPKAEIREIAAIMINRRIGCVPITQEQGELLGILTRSDILRTIVNQAPIELWS